MTGYSLGVLYMITSSLLSLVALTSVLMFLSIGRLASFILMAFWSITRSDILSPAPKHRLSDVKFYMI